MSSLRNLLDDLSEDGRKIKITLEVDDSTADEFDEDDLDEESDDEENPDDEDEDED